MRQCFLLTKWCENLIVTCMCVYINMNLLSFCVTLPFHFSKWRGTVPCCDVIIEFRNGVWFLMTVLSFPWICEYNDEFLFSCSGLPEECKVQTPAFTDAVRLYRQAHGHYGTWDMMCGTPPQVKKKKKKLVLV